MTNTKTISNARFGRVLAVRTLKIRKSAGEPVGRMNHLPEISPNDVDELFNSAQKKSYEMQLAA